MGEGYSKAAAVFQELLDIIARLRSPEGCLWDRRQEKRDIGRYLIEEAYEVLEAIGKDVPGGLKEELGDLLFQILFLAQIAEEKGEFCIEGVLTGISEKMIRRHPHVFGNRKVETVEEIKVNWEDIKRNVERRGEKGGSVLGGIPSGIPPMLRAQKMTEAAAKVGFDWDDMQGVILKIEEEMAELKEALSCSENERIKDEIGDILFSFVNLSRFAGISADEALMSTNRKFMARFLYVEEKLRTQGKQPGEATLQEMDDLWNEAKKMENRYKENVKP